jgi:hypothetical protein
MFTLFHHTIGIVIAGKVQMYRREHSLEYSEQVCNTPLPANEWPHPARQVTITETSELTRYPIEIYTDGSKDGGKVGAGVAIYSNKQLVKQCIYVCMYCIYVCIVYMYCMYVCILCIVCMY